MEEAPENSRESLHSAHANRIYVKIPLDSTEHLKGIGWLNMLDLYQLQCSNYLLHIRISHPQLVLSI